MSKISLIILCLMLAFSLCACSVETSSSTDTEDVSTDSPSSEDENIESVCEHTFKEEIQKEAGYGVDGFKVKYCTKCSEIEYIKIPALESIFELTVKNKVAYVEENTGHVFFEIEIKNISNKKIESISGTLSVMPPDCILELTCDFNDVSIEPYSTVTLDPYGYTFGYNSEVDGVKKKVYNAKFEDTKFYFTPTSVVVDE